MRQWGRVCGVEVVRKLGDVHVPSLVGEKDGG
jgi:hypothetical protein